jgi:hypothetical protein
LQWQTGQRRWPSFATVFAVLVGGWMFRYEPIGQGFEHRNRFTGATSRVSLECWTDKD